MKWCIQSQIFLLIIIAVSAGVLFWYDKVDQAYVDNYNVKIGESECAIVPISISEPQTWHDKFDTRPLFNLSGGQCVKQANDQKWHCSYTCYIKNINVTLFLDN